MAASPEFIQFAVAPHTQKDNGLQVCADIDVQRFFFEYTVSSRAEDDRISFFVQLENLARAVKSCCSDKRVEHVLLKLTKKNGMPVLAFEIRLDQALGVQVIHEVPIRIVSDQSECAAFTEPPLGEDSSAAVSRAWSDEGQGHGQTQGGRGPGQLAV